MPSLIGTAMNTASAAAPTLRLPAGAATVLVYIELANLVRRQRTL